jgi:hypothetical protein
MVVGSDLDLLTYSFHYADPDQAMLWRHDKHPGHEHEDGRESHVHLPGGKRLPEPEVDFEEVIEEILQDQQRRYGFPI